MTRNSRRRMCAAAAGGVVWLLPLTTVPAEQAEDVQDPVPIETGQSEAIVVIGERPPSDAATLDASVIESGRAPNLGLALRSIAGIDGVRRGQNALEPVIRGLGWERVQTELDGIPLHGACPARMDPPAATIGSGLVQKVEVIKGIPPVSLGPAGTGGRILISTDYDRGQGAPRGLQTWLNATYDTARHGSASEIGMQGGTERFDLRAGLEGLDHDDYQSAGGVEVPAGQKELGGFLSLGFRPSATQRWNVGAIAKNGEDIEYPALPMNADALDDRMLRVGYRYAPPRGRLVQLSARIGVATVDHLMSNRGKPNRTMLEAETNSNADTISARFKARLALASRVTLEIGADHIDLERDALRERRTVASGVTSFDHIWPDVRQTDTGLFAEMTTTTENEGTLRAGLRADRVSSEALAADDASLLGLTIREQWQVFYGPAASRPDRDETLWSGNLQVEWGRSDTLRWFAGVGQTTRAASVTERYFAFAPAPGGYLVGNPALDAERKSEIVLGGHARWGWVRGSASVFFHDFEDYIYQSTREPIDHDDDPNTPDILVKGFRNVDATLYGGELSLVLVPSTRWSIPLTVAWVHAKNETAGRPLPEIPPLQATLAARAELLAPLAGWVEFGGRFVDRQDRVDAAFPEDETPGFAVFHLRVRVRATGNLDVELGVENLLDKEYHEHLTRETLLPVGDLGAGQEIPQPGLSAYITTRVTF